MTIVGLPRTLKPGMVIVLAGHITFSLTYQFLIPLGYGPDEPRHYGYIQHLVLYRSLPVLGAPSHPYYCHMDPRPPNAIGIHPPLYYLLLAPIYASLAGQRIDHPAQNQTHFKPVPHSQSKFIQHTLRTVSLTMTLATLFFVTRTALIFSNDEWWLLGIFGFVAWLPHFLLLSAVMNNDTITILLGHIFLFLLARQTLNPGNPLKNAVLLGSVFGLFGLSKASALSWLPLLLVGTWQILKRMQPSQRWKGIAISIGIPVLLCGWWYARFYALYGRIMPIVKWKENPELLLQSPADLFLRQDAWLLVWRFLTGVARSIWGQVDWFILKPEHIIAWQRKFGETVAETAYPITEPLWLLLVLLTLCALSGWLMRFFKWICQREWTEKNKAGLWVCSGFVLLFLALMHYTLFTHPGGYEGGRYLLPSVGAFAFLFWQGLFFLVPKRWQPVIVVEVLVLLLVMNVGCIVNLSNFLNPLYAPS
ncbi:MAG: hypothetical protein ACUVTP_09975 [Candidatus Fervidibacter sp.]|uniref:hypothetical protein n=1 Tax=Candidatus Fervidibacter sp. TaxID=3100871 RepID=UPI00404B15C0